MIGLPAPGERMHLLGIAGTAMASFAGILRRLGYRVSGSDQGVYPPMSTLLEREGIPVSSPWAAGNLPPDVRLVVVGNAISRGNPELEAALDRRLALVSFPEALRELVLRKRVPLVVAGTHGKTTTASLLATILVRSGVDAGYLIGGVPEDSGSSFRPGAEGAPFVLEGDEYDSAYWDKGPKFLHYLPEAAIIANVEFDHADIYPDFAAVRRAFSFLARLPPRRGLLLLGADSPAALALREHAHTHVQSFSLTEDRDAADWTARIAGSGPDGSRLAVCFRGEERPPLEGAFWGSAGARNALAAVAAASWVGVEWERIREAVAGFRGVKRRLEALGGADGGPLLARDFAHHPTAVRAAIESARARWPGAGITAVFEPRSFTARSAVFQKDFGAAFAGALRVLLAAAGDARGRRPTDALDRERLLSDIEARGIPAEAPPDRARLLRRVLDLASEPGPMVFLFLSNGWFDGIPEEAAEALSGGGPGKSPARPG